MGGSRLELEVDVNVVKVVVQCNMEEPSLEDRGSPIVQAHLLVGIHLGERYGEDVQTSNESGGLYNAY